MSKFKALFQEASQADPEPVKTAPKPSKAKKEPIEKESPTVTNTSHTAKAVRQQRTSGKRSDPNYTGVFAYIPAIMHEDVKAHLVRRKDLDFSGLVEQLLTKWLKDQK